jgi:hypothetical protein
MNALHAVILIGTFIVGIVGPAMERRSRRPRLWYATAQAIWWTGFCITGLLSRQMDYAVADVVAAALWAHLAWELWRRNRKPRVSRAAGRVVNLGHRLAVRAEASR